MLEDFACEFVCLLFAWGFRFGVVNIYPEPDPTRMILLFLDDVMVVGVILWLIYQLGVKFWNERVKINRLHVFVAA
jgi:hypothetical protein